ncbi:MAG: hypothetical protein IJN16_03465 [Lachnospiraceae bacterium]|nr:hypothetical protein [Lachnospiraceae bacterium]
MYVVWVDVKAYEGDDFLPIERECPFMGRKILARKKEFLPIPLKREAVGRERMEVGKKFSYHGGR